MAVPKRKTSPSRRGMRRSADALARPTYVEDKDSGELRRPHHVDLKTGMYRGRQVLKSKKEAGAPLDFAGDLPWAQARPASGPHCFGSGARQWRRRSMLAPAVR